jgi:hypothetical protein
MANITADRVLETSTTTGTGAYTLAGAVVGYRTFASALANGDVAEVFVEAVDGSGNPTGGWETGTYTFSGTTLTRTTITGSSNGGAAVDWAAGTRRIGLTNLASSYLTKRFSEVWFTGAARAFNNNPRTYSNILIPVVGSTTATGTYPVVKYFNTYEYRASGGTPTTVSNVTKFPANTPTGSTRVGNAWQVATRHDGTAFRLVVDCNTAATYRVMVDGRYTHTLTPLSGSGDAYYIIQLGERAVRTIEIEGQGDTAFRRIECLAGETVLPPLMPTTRLVLVGDSNAAGSGQTYVNDALGRVIADHVGIFDYWTLSAFGTGFVATNGGASNNYASRRADWNSINKDILVFAGSANDVNAGATAAAVKAAAITEITQARLTFKGPIFLIGLAGSKEYFTAQGVLATFQAHEQALKEAIEGFNDPLMKFIPMLSVNGNTPLTGTGAGTGNWDAYTQADGHLTTAGHLYMGRYLSIQMMQMIAEMAGLAIPAVDSLNLVSPRFVKPLPALNIDCNLGDFFTKTINANSALTFSNVPPAGIAYACTVELTHTSGTLTHPTGTIFAGGTAPTLTAGKVHLLYYLTRDGGAKWRCSILKDFAS